MTRGIKSDFQRAENKDCGKCGKPFLAIRTHRSRPLPVFCSYACRGAARKKQVERKCLHCGKDFSVPECRMRRKSAGRMSSFCSKKCHYASGGALRKRGAECVKNSQGYVFVYAPEGHPALNPNAKGIKQYRVREHILVMEKRLGRYLEPGENVHHLNGIRDDNRIENLELWVRPQPTGQRVKDLLARIRELESGG